MSGRGVFRILRIALFVVDISDWSGAPTGHAALMPQVIIPPKNLPLPRCMKIAPLMNLVSKQISVVLVERRAKTRTREHEREGERKEGGEKRRRRAE